MNHINQQIDKALQCLHWSTDMDYIGESVSQLEHALQGAYFAEQAGHSLEVILACLFHDIGHFATASKQNNMADLGVVHHEWLGAKLAYSLGFSAKVALLIGYHVDAKRYLAGKKKDYYARLSEASKGTLMFQGGVMSEEEMAHFESNPYFKDILRVRVNDEKAKEIGLKVPELAYYRPYLYQHFEQTARTIENTGVPNYVDSIWVEQVKAALENECFEGKFCSP